jgi:hypothetical protein
MSDLQTLLLVVVVLYITQCVEWIPEGCVVFREPVRRTWKLISAKTGFALMGRRPIWTHPLPPLGGVAACQPLPLRVSPGRIMGPAAPSLSRTRIRGEPEGGPRFDEIKRIEAAGNSVRIDGVAFVRASCDAQAQHLASFLSSLHRLKEKDRGAAIDAEWTAMLNVEEVAERLRTYRELSAKLMVSCNLLFAFLFALAPLAIWEFGLARTWKLLAAVLLVFLGLIARQFTRAHRKLFPAAGDTPWPTIVSVLLSPLAAIRARDALVRDLFCAFHPLAVTRALCDEAVFRSSAAKALREASFFGAPPDAAKDTPLWREEEWCRGKEQAALRKFIAKAGEDPEKLLAPPARESETCQSYCPRCCAQFALTTGTCEECGGVALRPFQGRSEAG